MNEIRFKRDTAFRKQFFVPDSFAHPAKMDAQLLIWIVEKFTEQGETILDPMAGSGTLMLACGLGRNVVMVELEEKFVRMQRDNWAKVSTMPQLGYTMGTTKLACGDARSLSVLIPNIDLLDEIDGNSKIAVLYLSVGKVNDDKSLILEVFIPTSLASLIPMPITPIGLDDKVFPIDKKVHDISTDANLLAEVHSLFSQLFSQDSFDVCFSLNQTASSATESPTSIYERFTRIKGLATSGALEIPSFSHRLPSAPDRAKPTLTILGLCIPSKKWLSAYLARSANLFGVVGIPTRLTTKSGVLLKTRWTDLKYLSALLAYGSGLDDSSLPSESAFTGTETSTSSAQVRLLNGEWLTAQFTGSLLLQTRSTHNVIIQEDASNVNSGGLLADKIVSSPPFGEAHNQRGLGVGDNDRADLRGYSYLKSGTSGQIGDLAYGDIDKIVTSPPYEGALTSSSQHGNTGIAADNPKLADTGRYKAENQDNIGNLKGSTYLESMYQVYRQCHAVLKSGGLMVLVTKNFIRNKEQVRLDEDTIKICEKAGFKYLERYYRKLSAQSFWRIIYHQRYPSVPPIIHEDILVFGK